MNNAQKLERGVRAVTPLVASVTGLQVPAFEIYARPRTDYERVMGVEGSPEGALRFCYDPDRLAPYFENSTYTRGSTTRQLTHEVAHLATADALLSAAGRTRRQFISPRNSREASASPLTRYAHWLEGTAELVATIGLFQSIKMERDSDLVRQVTGSADRDALPQRMGYGLGDTLINLHLGNYLPVPKSDKLPPLDVLGLPIEIPQSVRERTEFYVDNVDTTKKSPPEYLPYDLGLYRCCRAVSTGRVSLRHLLTHPKNNNQLRDLAR